MIAPAPSQSAPDAAPAPDAIDASSRVPLLVLFLSGAVWLVIGSAFALISSIKFHAPRFLADSPLLTYGRVYPASANCFLYGFGLPVGLGVALWLIARLGRAPLAQSWLITVGAMVWNLGVTVGVVAILAGDSTGFENLEMPRYAAVLCFLAYLLIGIRGVVTFHHRRERLLFVSQWFLFTALFWFPWIYSTAYLLLTVFPVRGVMQAVIAWWYSNNLLAVWLALVGLGGVFYFVPKLTRRELHSHYLALFAFWMLILFASWGGIPNSAPVPAWMPAASAAATLLTLIPLLAVAVNILQTLFPAGVAQASSPASSPGVPPGVPGNGSLPFILFGAAAFVLAGLMRIYSAFLDTTQLLHFTWFARAQSLLNSYGFFVLVMFGAVYYILPRLTGTAFRFPALIRLHFWLAAVGVLFLILPLVIGGLLGAAQLQDYHIPFIDIAKRSLVFLRLSTMGDLLLLAGHLVFLGNLLGLAGQFYRARVAAAYAVGAADLFETAEVQS